jgi:cobalt-zinc-cadmium efflux system outer membrane protein
VLHLSILTPLGSCLSPNTVDTTDKVKPVSHWAGKVRKLLVLPLTLLLGCQTWQSQATPDVEAQVAALAPIKPAVEAGSPPLPSPQPTGPLGLPELWQLALEYQPDLRQAAALVAVAEGRVIQAGKYPNPVFKFEDDGLGTSKGPPGSILLSVHQPIVTGGKRRLDQEISLRDRDVSSLVLVRRKFEILTRIRRSYYDYLGWSETVRTNEEVTVSLQEGLDLTRRLVEQAKTRPSTDLIRIETLIEESRNNLAHSRIQRDAAWQQLAADIGVAELPVQEPGRTPADVPGWDKSQVLERIHKVNTQLKEAAIAVERARLEYERARAEVIPNVTIGGGYARDFPDGYGGAVLTLDAPIPLWDRNQGRIYEARARWAHAQAGVGETTARLNRDAAAALARYESARQQVERLEKEILPRQRQNLKLMRAGYQAGANQVTFNDVFLAEQALNSSRLSLVEAKRNLWVAVADLQGLMQLDIDE